MSEIISVGIASVAVALVGLLFFSRLRIRTVAILVVAVAAVFVGSVFLFERLLDRTFESRHGPPYVFHLSDRPPFLTEDIAIEKARAALVLDGLGQDCQPVADGRSFAPNGRQDTYLVRNTTNPNAGSLVYTNTAGERFLVHVELTDQRLTCRRIVLK